MKRLQPVIWMKGTFLSPHYLQTQDRFTESTLEFSMDALSFAPWGFKRLQVNQDALDTGTFALTDAAGIFPDGLIFDIPDSDPSPSPKPLIDSFEPDQKTLDVFLAIPHYRDRGLNVSIAQKKADTRFLAEVAMLRDENSGLTEKPVQVARKNFRFLLEVESQQHISVLRVARVIKTDAGTLQLDPDFVPPMLDITASDYLVSISRRLVEILAAKSTTLSANRRQKHLSLAEFGTSDIANFWLLYTINSHFPLLQHIFETRASREPVCDHALAGRLPDHVFQGHPSARSAQIRARRSVRLFPRSRRENPLPSRNGGPDQFHLAAAQAHQPVHLRYVACR